MRNHWNNWGREITGWGLILVIVCTGSWFGAEVGANYIRALIDGGQWGK